MIVRLYDEMLVHHGERIGMKHARKHLGWALDAAATTAGLEAATLKEMRAHVLTAPNPSETHARLSRAFATMSANPREEERAAA